jgi:hypothetical protein
MYAAITVVANYALVLTLLPAALILRGRGARSVLKEAFEACLGFSSFSRSLGGGGGGGGGSDGSGGGGGGVRYGGGSRDSEVGGSGIVGVGDGDTDGGSSGVTAGRRSGQMVLYPSKVMMALRSMVTSPNKSTGYSPLGSEAAFTTQDKYADCATETSSASSHAGADAVGTRQGSAGCEAEPTAPPCLTLRLKFDRVVRGFKAFCQLVSTRAATR